ncbi:MAG: N-acetylglucosamine-6-phosphate deacetylase [Chloroflexi bacterium]|nr:N-acetylglucosamine-6-phosphate deacetylase [Chloroflexota bacterium]
MIRLAGHLYAPDDRGLALVTVDDGTVAAIEPLDPAVPLPAGTIGGPASRLLPGLVDIQVNGAFGHDFADPAADMAMICRRLPELGVTAFVPTIVTSPPAAYAPALANLRRPPLPGEARVLGVHIEGPFISSAHPGTHDPALIRPPDVGEAAAWLATGDVRWLTLAPELPGALGLVRFLADRGVRVSMGHTDATWADAEAAVGAGTSLVTHLFNAMRPLRHRDPGVAGYALASSLPVGVIGDGHHLAFETLRLIARVKAPDELYLVTDALAGLGMPPGRYSLAGREYVSDGTCGRLPDGTLSGSLLSLPLAIRNLVEEVGLDPALAIRMATLNPARALDLGTDLGRIEPGRTANLVVVDDAWAVQATVAGGALAFDAARRAASPVRTEP